MHGRYPFYPSPRSESTPRQVPRPAHRPPLSARDRLRRAHRFRARALRELGIEIPLAVLDRHPKNLTWRVSVMDRWIARHLDLAGGKRLSAWEDDDAEDPETEEDEDLDGDVRVRSRR